MSLIRYLGKIPGLSLFTSEGDNMSEEHKTLERMLAQGKVSLHEFEMRLTLDFEELGQQLMNGEITPDEHVEKYNELVKMERNPFGPPQKHEHI
jgi:hypothetical protein|uniref:Uncharacterized protein n=2 Tax=root TaxID=1 RepID=A0A8S5NW43_9CAUD|nr:MAG TPA: hypothetical protein [Siphoviridae sp. ctQLz13]